MEPIKRIRRIKKLIESCGYLQDVSMLKRHGGIRLFEDGTDSKPLIKIKRDRFINRINLANELLKEELKWLCLFSLTCDREIKTWSESLKQPDYEGNN
jgi:hypothetical protein